MAGEDDKQLPRIARFKPYYFKPVAGKKYFWCTCGRSATQPFCDGSHKGTSFEPLAYTAAENQKEVLLCGCKHTNAPPICDGSHNNLRGTYDLDDPDSEVNQHKARVTHHRGGIFELNGACFVSRTDLLPLKTIGNIDWSPVVTSTNGAQHQSMFFMKVNPGTSPVISFDAAEVVLFATEAISEISIAGRSFTPQAGGGIYVREGEAFTIRNASDKPISVYVSVCPLAGEPSFDGPMGGNFDSRQPQRVVPIDPAKHHPMADRSFQLLVDKEVGSHAVTQFIGNIPCSKAAPHRHLYEEALLILKGKGMMWTEDLKTDVRAGDVVFLPSKQVHSLQCTDPTGMEVVGVIYPGGSPDINF